MKEPTKKNSADLPELPPLPPHLAEEPALTDVYFGEDQIDEVVGGYYGEEAAKRVKDKVANS